MMPRKWGANKNSKAKGAPVAVAEQLEIPKPAPVIVKAKTAQELEMDRFKKLSWQERLAELVIDKPEPVVDTLDIAESPAVNEPQAVQDEAPAPSADILVRLDYDIRTTHQQCARAAAFVIQDELLNLVAG